MAKGTRPNRVPRTCGHCGRVESIEMVVDGSDRCRACARYRKKHGVDRPPMLLARQAAKPLGLKICGTCGCTLALDQFHRSRHYGYQSRCRRCQQAYKITWIANNPDRAREMGRRYSRSPKGRETWHRRKARILGAYVAPVDPIAIYERDGWRCRLCRKRVARNRPGRDPMAPSLDHIIPLAEGGTHEPANVQCAHLRCNLVKRHRGGGEQLLLFG